MKNLFIFRAFLRALFYFIKPPIPIQKAKPAFSLVEMLMALLVASLLLAALAPVVTKRLTDETLNVVGAAGGGRAPAMFKCWDYDDPTLVYEEGTNYKVLQEDYPVEDAWIANFIIASGGGGGAGATASATVEDSYSEPETGMANGIKIEFNMDEFEIETMTGGGGGAGGGAAEYSGAICSGAPSISKCECMGTIYDDINKICVSTNQGATDFNGAKTKCAALNSSIGGVWSPPSMNQMENWSQSSDGAETFYSKLGIRNDTSVWSADSDACINTVEATCWGCRYRWCWGCGGRGNVPQNKDWYYCAGSTYKRTPDCYSPSYCTGNQGTHCYGASVEGHSSLESCMTASVNYGFQRCTSCTSYTCEHNTSCGTYYKYYTLSGSSWNGVSDSKSSSDSRSVYCVYSDSTDVNGEKFYSLSGGGGSSAPSITDNLFDNNAKERLKTAIKNNVGGYIVLDIGDGGKGGDGASSKGGKADNGNDGEESCIVIQNKNHEPRFKLCIKGGKGGKGADAGIADAANNGYGRKGESVGKENSCYIYDYTVSNNNKIEFNCTNSGKDAGNGGASTDNPTAGGLGGASVLNSDRVSNNGKDGVTPDSALSPGAGGGGGSAIKSGTGSSASFGFGSGGNGAKGYIKIKFKHKYEAAGGGGGGAGYVAHIRNINMGKSATCKIKVGFGGGGGAAGIKGSDGGESSISCSNAANVTYRVTGGKGGEIGISASAAAGSSSTGGFGGKAGTYDDIGNIFTRLFSQGNFTGYKGLEGKQGGAGENANYKEGVRSAGGRGGTSGTGEKGKCGGLYNEASVCSMVSPDENNDIIEPGQNSLNGEGFGNGEISVPTKDSIVQTNPKFGKAGAGGGGGAWYMGKEPGKGGDGLGGYVCIYWDKIE